MADPPTVDEFAARHKPQQAHIAQLLEETGLWDAVDRLRLVHHLGWIPIAEYLALHNIQVSESTVSKLWRKRQTR